MNPVFAPLPVAATLVPPNNIENELEGLTKIVAIENQCPPSLFMNSEFTSSSFLNNLVTDQSEFITSFTYFKSNSSIHRIESVVLKTYKQIQNNQSGRVVLISMGNKYKPGEQEVTWRAPNYHALVDIGLLKSDGLVVDCSFGSVDIIHDPYHTQGVLHSKPTLSSRTCYQSMYKKYYCIIGFELKFCHLLGWRHILKVKYSAYVPYFFKSGLNTFNSCCSMFQTDEPYDTCTAFGFHGALDREVCNSVRWAYCQRFANAPVSMQSCLEPKCLPVFGPWSECDDSKESKIRYGSLSSTRADDGGVCPSLAVFDTRDCQSCSVDWGNWSACSSGTRTRIGYETQEAFGGGKNCTDLFQTETCSSDCVITYSNWSPCDPATGKQQRTATLTPAFNGGIQCPPISQLTLTQTCSSGSGSGQSPGTSPGPGPSPSGNVLPLPDPSTTKVTDLNGLIAVASITGILLVIFTLHYSSRK